MANLDQLKEAEDLAKKILDLKRQGKDIDLENEEALQALNSLLQSSVDKRKENLEILQTQLQSTLDQANADGKLSASEVERLKNIRLRIKEENKLITAQDNRYIKALQGEQQLRDQINTRITEERTAKIKQADENLRTLKAEGASVRGIVATRQEGLDVMQATAIAASAITEAGTLGMVMMTNYLDTFNASLFGFDIGFKNMLVGMSQLAPNIESAIAGIARGTGLSLQSIQTNLIAAFDPSGASFAIGGMREQFQALADEIGEGGNFPEFFERSLELGEVNAAFKALIGNAAMFREGFLEAQPATAALTANLVAGLERIGVATGDSSEIFDLFNKAMRKSPVGAGKSLRSLANISKTLGIEFSKSFTNFRAVMDPLSQFGDRMTGVFSKLQARAAATGTELSKLSGIAEGMDTFEGAAKAAQTLNGILGDTFINVTDLALADPDEKIKMITDAIKDSGVEFDSLNRQYKKVIATAAGFDSVGEFQRQIFNEDEINKATNALDVNAMSMSELNKLLNDGLNVTEKQQRAVSAFGASAATSMNTARNSSKELNEAMGLLMRETAAETKDPAGAFLASLMATAGAARGEAVVGPQAAAGLAKGVAAKAGAAVSVASTAMQLFDKAQTEGLQSAVKPGTPMQLSVPQAAQPQAVQTERPSEIVVMSFDPDSRKGLARLVYPMVDKALAKKASR
jgi:hypothetical protein